jgi:hypothetical protein
MVMKQFSFEKVFDGQASNEDVFEACEESVKEVLCGGNVCILAYGQTGSGKTYSMHGLIQQSLLLILDSSLKSSQSEVSLQCLEVYNDQVRNLFSQESESRVNKLTEFLVKSTVPILDCSPEAVLQLIEQLNESRTTKFTEANERSSRSHLIITLIIKRGEWAGKLQFVDLAGSERLNASKVKGDMLKETLSINKSLTALQDVIAALESKSMHVPYRNSILTLLLQPVFSSPASKLLVLFNVAPSEAHLPETLCTLSLAVRLKSVELGANIRQSLKNQQVERTLSLLEKEREEKLMLIRGKEKLERDLGSYTQAMKEKDNKLAVVTARLKLLEKDHFDSTARLKREVEEYKQQFHMVSRKLRLVKVDPKPHKAESTSSTPPIIPEEPVLKAFSRSPSREVLNTGKLSQPRMHTSAKQWLTPNMKKAKEAIPRPQSVSKTTEGKSGKVKPRF